MFEVEYWRSARDGQWYFHVRDPGNHQVLASSEGYHDREDCLATAARFGTPLQRNAAAEPAGADGG
jgi:uncharacterized protein YegP (UPF0339 family)